MKIHLRYTQMLLNLSLVDEVHIWDICLDDLDNRALLYRFVNETNDPRYIIFPNPQQMVHYNVTKKGQGYLWEAYYHHYATHERYKDEDIIFKTDDDTVFVDVSSFASFLSQITTPNLYFPNIVNNDAGLYVQAKLNVHPVANNVLNFYESHKVPVHQLVNSYYTNSVVEAHSMPFGNICPLTYCTGGLYAKGVFADDIHKAFLSDPQKFIYNCQNGAPPTSTKQTHHFHHYRHHHLRNQSHIGETTNHTLESKAPPVDPINNRLFPVKRRISINMFAGKATMIRQMFKIFLDYQCCDDEGFVGKWPSLTQLDHLIDSHFVVVHFAFNAQYQLGKHFGEWVVQYDELSKKQYVAQFGEDIFDRAVFRSTFLTNGVLQQQQARNELETQTEEKKKQEQRVKLEKQKAIESYGNHFVWNEPL
jgi:hypothetical protein